MVLSGTEFCPYVAFFSLNYYSSSLKALHSHISQYHSVPIGVPTLKLGISSVLNCLCWARNGVPTPIFSTTHRNRLPSKDLWHRLIMLRNWKGQTWRYFYISGGWAGRQRVRDLPLLHLTTPDRISAVGGGAPSSTCRATPLTAPEPLAPGATCCVPRALCSVPGAAREVLRASARWHRRRDAIRGALGVGGGARCCCVLRAGRCGRGQVHGARGGERGIWDAALPQRLALALCTAPHAPPPRENPHRC